MISLPLHGPQTTMLPRNPLLSPAQVIRIRKVKLVLGVVVPGKVLQDSLAFHDGEAVAVMVDYDGDAAVGAELGEPWLFLDIWDGVVSAMSKAEDTAFHNVLSVMLMDWKV